MSAAIVLRPAEVITKESSPSDALARLDRARQMLAEARTLSEIKKVRDVAEAARTYAKAAHLGRQSQNLAAEIALVASRKAGEILGQLQKSKGGRPEKTAANVAVVSEYTKALEDTDTPERTARHWQQLAGVPEQDVQRYIDNCKLALDEISAAGLLRQAKIHSRASQAHSSDSSETQRQLKAAYPLVDLRVRKSSFKNMTRRDCFDLELRSLTADELRVACAGVQTVRQTRGRAA